MGPRRRDAGGAGDSSGADRWQDGWQSVDIDRLSVDEARARLAEIRERRHEGISYEGEELDAADYGPLQARVLSEADGWELRAELHAAAERMATATDPAVRTDERRWMSAIEDAFLDRAETYTLEAEVRDPFPDPGGKSSWRRTVDTEIHERKQIAQIAQIALEELRRWDGFSGSQASGERLRTIAAAAERLAGPEGLERFLRHLAVVDHEFHSDQLEHFSAAIGRDAAVEMATKMEGRDVDVGPTRPVGTFWDSAWRDLESGQVRDNLWTAAKAIGEKLASDLEGLADQVERGVRDPVGAARRAAAAVRDLPGDIYDAVVAIPEIPDRARAAWRRFDQADESGQVRMIAEGTYEFGKSALIDRGVGKIAGEVVDAVTPDGLRVGQKQGPDQDVVPDPPPSTRLTAGTGGIESITTDIVDNCNVTIIKGALKPTIPRDLAPNYNEGEFYASATKVGLPGYHKAHLWGPGFGDEAYDGITYAPSDLNLVWQRHGVEERIRELEKLTRQRGLTLQLIAEARTHPRDVAGGNALAQVKYTLDIRLPNGQLRRVYQVQLDVDPPPSGKVSDPVVIEGEWSPHGGDARWLGLPILAGPEHLFDPKAKEATEAKQATEEDNEQEDNEQQDNEREDGWGVLLPPEERPAPGSGVLLDPPQPTAGPVEGPLPLPDASEDDDGPLLPAVLGAIGGLFLPDQLANQSVDDDAGEPDVVPAPGADGPLPLPDAQDDRDVPAPGDEPALPLPDDDAGSHDGEDVDAGPVVAPPDADSVDDDEQPTVVIEVPPPEIPNLDGPR